MKSIDENSLVLPMIIFRGKGLFFPSQTSTIKIGRESSRLAIKSSVNEYSNRIIVCFTNNKDKEDLLFGDLFPVGLLGTVDSIVQKDEALIDAVIHFDERVKLLKIEEKKDKTADGEIYQTVLSNQLINIDFPGKAQTQMFINSLKQKINLLDYYDKAKQEFDSLDYSQFDISAYCDKIAVIFNMNDKFSQSYLFSNSVIERMQIILDYFDSIKGNSNIYTSITNNTDAGSKITSVKVWVNIYKLSNLTLIVGLVIALLTVVSSIISSILLESFLDAIIGVIISITIVTLSFISSVLIMGFAQIVRNNEEQISERNID